MPLKEEYREILRTTLLRHGVHAAPARGTRRGAVGEGEELWDLGAPTQPTTRFRVVPLAAERGTIREDGGQAYPRLWVAEHIPHVVANRLIAAGQTFADGAGNVHLEIPGLIAHVLGNRPARTPKQRRDEPLPRAWRRPAIRVLFRLLCDPAFGGRPLREVAAVTGVAVGTVVRLLNDLELTGNLVRLGGGRRRFVADRALVTRWILEYGLKLRPHLLLGRFTAGKRLEAFDPAAHGARWGGEQAARLLGAELQPGVWTIYADEKAPDLLRAATLRPDPKGEVELRQTFWTGELGAPRKDVTPPLLIVADLLATRDGRCHAAAQNIDRTHLDGLLERD